MVVAVDGGPNQQEKTGVAKAEKRRAANGLADLFWTQDVICNGRFSEVEPQHKVLFARWRDEVRTEGQAVLFEAEAALTADCINCHLVPSSY